MRSPDSRCCFIGCMLLFAVIALTRWFNSETQSQPYRLMPESSSSRLAASVKEVSTPSPIVPTPSTVMIIGASGYIGSALLATLKGRWDTIAECRPPM